MDLKIKDVADLLSVSETTIRRWLSDGKIPAYKLNRQYRFSRIEIENWMMKQKLNMTEENKEIFVSGEKQIYPMKQESASGPQQYSLYRAINRGGVYASLEADTKDLLIQKAMREVAPKLSLDPDVLSDMLLDRENLTPTALNNGVAVPHTRESLQKVPFDLVSVVFPETPIEYGALDEKPVEVLFFLFASGDKLHLHLLSKIAHLSSDPEALAFLKTRPEKTKLLEFIKQWEGNLRHH